MQTDLFFSSTSASYSFILKYKRKDYLIEMAEAVVSFVIERLGDLLIKKFVFLKGVQGQVERLRDELVRIRSFLNDADQKQDEDERIRNWVSEMKAVGYDSEDVIEVFISEIESIRKKGLLKKLAYWPIRMRCLYKVGKGIESIQLRISDIADSREKFGIRNLGEGTSINGEELQRLRRFPPFVEDKDIVGLEEKKKDLVAQLLQEDNRRRVFSITGMGGVGKTTLARNLYNHADVKTRFDCRAWVYVSVSYNFRDILRTIIKQVKPVSNELSDNLEKMGEEEMEKMLHEHLQDKCYLVVLDDIWKEEAWDCLDRVFPDAGKGSRLLLTSRNESVPLHADALSTPYRLKLLDQEESWLLFLKKAFRDSPDTSCPLNLEDIAREIAGRCAGLPLAITIIGSLLLGKRRLRSDWQIVLNDISTYLSRGQNGVSAILELSYRDLPPNLKFCFLYLGLFPENCEIPMQKLVHTWVAEGIIPKCETKCLEDVAADYMEQLLTRNMVQVAAITVDDRVKSYRIHDLL